MKKRNRSTPAMALVFVAALQLLSSNVHGETWKSQELNCEITLPSGPDWLAVPPPAPIVKLAMRNQAGGKTMALYVVDAPQGAQTLSSFLPGFKKSWFKEGVSSNSSEETIAIDGRSARRLKDTAVMSGIVMQRANTVVIDDGKVYQITAMSRSGNPVDDPELGTVLKSFHFLSAASPVPTPSSSPAKLPRQDPAEHLAGLIGSITGYLLVGVAAIFLIIKLTARRKPSS